jgi:hypothetical protein
MITNTMMTPRGALVALVALTPALLIGQTLERRVAAAPAGSVAFMFNTKPNVCGDGHSINMSDDTSDGWNTRRSRSGIHIGTMRSGYRELCEIAPARAVVEHERGKVRSVRVTVGGRQESARTELGDVAAVDAANYLLSLAPALDGRSADAAILGAAIADSAVIWKDLLRIARDEGASEKARKSALFWVSQEATTAALAGLDSIATDDDGDVRVRADALFHLANRPNGEGIPSLIRVVKESKHAKLRRDAIFHLSQPGDPRALALFEQLLAGK